MARETPEIADPKPPGPRSISQLVLLACAFAVPVIGFLMAMAMWWMLNGLPGQGRGLWAGLMLVFGMGVIAAAYWAADRYWIRPRR